MERLAMVQARRAGSTHQTKAAAALDVTRQQE